MSHPSGLSWEDIAKIEGSIAYARAIQEPILIAADPVTLELLYGPNVTKKPAAWVCLSDAAEMLTESWYALVQATAYRVAYDRGLDPSDAQLSPRLFEAQFYVDDTVLRLYAAAESAAECVKSFYDLDLADALRVAREARQERASAFINVCNAIHTVQLPGDIAAKMLLMRSATETRWVADYRDSWMHRQRRRMAGTGLRFGRNNYQPRAKHTTTEKGTPIVTLNVVSGDEDETSITEAMDAVTTVYHLLFDLIDTCHKTLAADVPESGPGWKRK